MLGNNYAKVILPLHLFIVAMLIFTKGNKEKEKEKKTC